MNPGVHAHPKRTVMHRPSQIVTLVAIAAVLLPGCALKGRKTSRFEHQSQTERTAGDCNCYTCRHSGAPAGNSFANPVFVSEKVIGAAPENVSYVDAPINVDAVQPSAQPYYVEESTNRWEEAMPLNTTSTENQFSIDSIEPVPPSNEPANIIEAKPETEVPAVDQKQFDSPSDIPDFDVSSRNESKDFLSSDTKADSGETANIDATPDIDAATKDNSAPDLDPDSVVASKAEVQIEQEAPAVREQPNTAEKEVVAEEKAVISTTLATVQSNRLKLKARPVASVKVPSVSSTPHSQHYIPAIPASLINAIPMNDLRPKAEPLATQSPAKAIEPKAAPIINALPPHPTVPVSKPSRNIRTPKSKPEFD